VPVLAALLSMRKNDVIECLLREREFGNSILMELELENMNIVTKLRGGSKAYSTSKSNIQNFNADINVSFAVAGEDERDNQERDDLTNEANVDEEADVESSPASPLRDDERDALLSELKRSNDLLSAVLPSINDNAMISVSFHAHECFFNGLLYEQY
jgi:hypothetical protein